MIGLLLPFRVHLEHLQLLRSVYRLPIIVVDGQSIQRLAVYFVAIVPQPYNDGVGVQDGLDVLGLPCVAIGLFDGEWDEMISIISLESRWDRVHVGAVCYVRISKTLTYRLWLRE